MKFGAGKFANEPIHVIGELHGWGFKRDWYYYHCSGNGIPPEYADVLHAAHGKSVRVDGHCGCPSPREWCKNFAVGHYHVDSPTGLKALATVIKAVAEGVPPNEIEFEDVPEEKAES